MKKLIIPFFLILVLSSCYEESEGTTTTIKYTKVVMKVERTGTDLIDVSYDIPDKRPQYVISYTSDWEKQLNSGRIEGHYTLCAENKRSTGSIKLSIISYYDKTVTTCEDTGEDDEDGDDILECDTENSSSYYTKDTITDKKTCIYRRNQNSK